LYFKIIETYFHLNFDFYYYFKLHLNLVAL